MFATRARKGVENARLTLDAAKTKAKGGLFQLPGQKQQMHTEAEATEEEKMEIEQAEDEFVGQTEEAVGVMKNVRIDQPVFVLESSLTDIYLGS